MNSYQRLKYRLAKAEQRNKDLKEDIRQLVVGEPLAKELTRAKYWVQYNVVGMEEAQLLSGDIAAASSGLLVSSFEHCPEPKTASELLAKTMVRSNGTARVGKIYKIWQRR